MATTLILNLKWSNVMINEIPALHHSDPTQVCFQLWMATTLTSDAVAVAVQSLLAKSMAQGVHGCAIVLVL